jgi:hypothetical protein
MTAIPTCLVRGRLAERPHHERALQAESTTAGDGCGVSTVEGCRGNP